MVEEQSKTMSLNSTDYKKIAKGAAIAFGGAALIQLASYLTTGVIFDWRIWLGGILSTGINATLKYFKDTKI